MNLFEIAVGIVGEPYRVFVERSNPGEWVWRTEGSSRDMIVTGRELDTGAKTFKLRFTGEDYFTDVREIAQNRQACPVRLVEAVS